MTSGEGVRYHGSRGIPGGRPLQIPASTIERTSRPPLPHGRRAGLRRAALGLVAALSLAGPATAAEEAAEPGPATEAFLRLLVGNPGTTSESLAWIEANWHPGFVAMSLDVMRFFRTPQTTIALLGLIERETGQSLGFELDAWYRYVWNREPDYHPEYRAFRRALFELLDPRFAEYFAPGRASTIRLDEVVWGGVRQDGIPPLRDPKMIGADEATYLDDGDVVFGIEVEGDARGYPKRILAWHEMFVDEVGGVAVAGVYCTLCGTVILYETRHAGVGHVLGTSGFLYRSNKLMYDRATSSLWSTMRGEPVIGPLVGKDIELARRSVVTTTWGEWRRRHPDTRVLSLDTGHQRDYAEGAAYREYFASPELMFPVPVTDDRLRHKDEVLGVLLARHPEQPLALSARYLAEHPVHHDRIGEVELVVITDPSGANRVYESADVRFVGFDGDATVTDQAGGSWRLGEAALTSEDGRTLSRLPAQRAFWFGWFSAFNRTRLVD